MTRRRKKLLLGFGSFLLCIAAFLVIEHFRGWWALNRWKARTAAKGEELNIDKLTPIPPTGEENGLPQLLWVAGQLGQLAFELQPPSSRYVAPGKWVVVARINEWRLRDSKRPIVTWAEVAENIALCDQRLEAALEALQGTAFHANLYYRGGFNGLSFNHLARMKSLAQFLSAAALHDLHQGQNDAALRKLHGLLALPNVLKDEPTIISQLVRIAMMHVALGTTWQALQCDGWTDAQLAALEDAWSSYDFLRTMDKAFAMERAVAGVEYERCRSSDAPLASIFDQARAFTPAPSPSVLSWDWVEHMFDPTERVFAPIWRFAWSKHDELHYCETVQTVLELHRNGIATRSGLPAIAGIERVESAPLGAYDRLRFLVSRMIGGSLSGSMRRAWIAQASAELARTAIAIKRYEVREGKLPCSLEALVPELVPELPIDYMDGKPLRYCLDVDGGFRLYSVGIDGHDGHGDASPTANNLNYQSTRDLIWPQPASEVEVALWSMYALPRRGGAASGK